MLFDIVELELHNPNMTPAECAEEAQPFFGQHEYDDEFVMIDSINAATDCKVKVFAYYFADGYTRATCGV
jgi:hypothetical protein